MKVSIVIPNYNGEELLRKNLPTVITAVFSYKDSDVEIIIVDDASEDNSISAIESVINSKSANLKPKIKILRNSKNLGFSSSINKGVKESNGEIAVLLNTDVIPEINFLKPLVDHFKDDKVFAAGALDKSVENGKIILRGRGVGKWERGFLMHSRGEINKTNTLWVNGGSGAFRKSVWEKLGGFSELYNPFYWEDIDFSYRALKSGYNAIFEPGSVVVHEHEKGAIKGNYSKFEIKTIAYKNQLIFIWENITDFNLQMSHIIWLPYHFLKSLITMDWAFFIGFSKAFILLPKIIKSSFNAQKYFVKTDKKVLENFKE